MVKIPGLGATISTKLIAGASAAMLSLAAPVALDRQALPNASDHPAGPAAGTSTALGTKHQ
jgi:hypothetical protein